MDPILFQRFCDLTYSCAGIRLREGKEALITARIGKRMRSLGLATPRNYLDYLEKHRAEEVTHFVDAISTNYTGFYRERDHFDTLEHLVTRRLAARPKKMRLWSAACSSGEEPYSMAISLSETIGERDVDWRILATDISTNMLQKAREGIYAAPSLKPLGGVLARRYFDGLGQKDRLGHRLYRIKDELRKRVVYRRLNLSNPPFPMRGPLDVIFCRNVMIYFDAQARRPLVAEMEKLIAPGGHLIVGHSETLSGMITNLSPVRPSVYSKGAAPSRARQPSRDTV